jgi:ADP-ribose pyrophosphatase YjhB (NUDIX family)
MVVLAALSPTDPPGELVAWAWVVDEAFAHTLLVRHARRGTWLPPGGRARPGEPPVDAARRELREEAGLTATLARPAPVLVDAVIHRDPSGRDVYTFGVAHLFVASLDDELVPEAGQPAQWWPLDAPPEHRAEHHWQRLTRAIAPG